MMPPPATMPHSSLLLIEAKKRRSEAQTDAHALLGHKPTMT